MIEIGNIVTLENGDEYLLLEELTKNGNRYVYSVKVLPDETPTNEYIIFQAIKSDDGEYLKNIDTKEEYDALIEEFKNVISDKILSGDYDQLLNTDED